MPLLRRRFILLPLLALLLGAVSLPGCWPLTDTAPQPSPGPSGTPSPSEEGRIPPADNDTLNIAGQEDDPPTLDPALATDAYSLLVIRQLFSGLVAFDERLNVVPDLASALPQVSPDGTTYTFSLRRGARFTNGQEVTSADFKYSFERAADPRLAGAHPASALPAAHFLGDIVGVKEKLAGTATEITGVQTPDPYTLVLKIDAPRSYFLAKLTAGPTFVVQRANVEKSPTWTEEPVGTGPFKLQRWVHHQQMVLAANTDYYGGAPSVKVINIWMGANAAGQLQQYEREGSALDVATVPTDELERVTDRDNPLSRELQSVPEMAVTYLGFNLRHKPFDDPAVREALARVIDRQRIARVMFQSRVRPAQGFMPPGMGGYTPAGRSEDFNITRARQLLSESSYKSADNLPRLRLYTSGDLLGPMLQEVLTRTLGIDLELHEVEWTDYLAGLERGDYPMFTLTWSADYPDPESMLGGLFRTASPTNYTAYHSGDVDEALEAASSEEDEQRRMATYAQVEARILGDYPAVPIYHPVTYTLVKPYVTGLRITPLGILSLKDVRVDRR